MIRNILIRGKNIPFIKGENVLIDHFNKVEQAKKFTNYIHSWEQSNVEIKQIEVSYVYMFGQNVGFVNLIVDAYLNGIKLPGFVFLRGDAVAILLLVNKKMVLTQQFRVPVGKYTIEAPAGMMDEQGDFGGVAAKEIKEETGISIQHNEMRYLQDMLVSPGGSDEVIHLFVVEKNMEQKQLDELCKKTHGAEGEGEQIKLVIQDFTWENVLKTYDSKLIAATAAYYNPKL
ncbi:unnamed protein product [Paramecium pentaurelia]|uniref:Nudix hydrolase domain-containing protein n=1 Tax=Paramecium pentaurelia TaxID=43138 RepID=A0A8S1Y7L2_9CILI|nr:unnamed protein product [Paramecium pentaurelia]